MPHGLYLFISDLHLDATSPDALAQFQRFLTTQANQCDGLYILGDLLESWIGDDDDDAARAAVCTALQGFTHRGTPCWVMRGNRDFLLGDQFERRTGCTLLPDPTLLQLGSHRVLITHGDLLCTADHRYQQFRTQVRSDAFQTPYLRLPLATRRALAVVARNSSREHTRRARVAIMDVTEAAVIAALQCGDCDLIIHGHTHRPGIHSHLVHGRRATRIVLGDWYSQGSCLAWRTDGSYELMALPRAGASTDNIEAMSARV